MNPARARGPWGWIGMLGLVVAIEAGLERHHLDLTRFYIHDWRVSGRAASRPALPERHTDRASPARPAAPCHREEPRL